MESWRFFGLVLGVGTGLIEGAVGISLSVDVISRKCSLRSCVPSRGLSECPSEQLPYGRRRELSSCCLPFLPRSPSACALSRGIIFSWLSQRGDPGRVSVSAGYPHA